MADNIEQFRQLVQRHIDNQLTEEEEEAFFSLLQQDEYRLLLQQVVDEKFRLSQLTGPSISPHRLQQIRDQILASKTTRQVPLFMLRRIAAAAAILLFIAGAVYFWRLSKQERMLTQVQPSQPADVAPGRNGAILTLADGQKVVLDSLGNGVIATQHGTRAVLQDGQLAYHSTGNETENIAYNTVTTPKGRQFQVQLPDGTHVWLNAASSITYPTVFKDKRREVTITGEVYFEVANLRLRSGQKQPFIVQVNKQTQIEVLGTHFNVNAYDNEGSIKTTLLEGKVRVASGKGPVAGGKATSESFQEVVLKPGEQAIASARSSLTIDHSPDIQQVMAWKSGLFNFNGRDIIAAMDEIGRWYDLEVMYESAPKPRQIVGEIQRNLTLSELMTVLKKLDIHYRLEGRQLIITP